MSRRDQEVEWLEGIGFLGPAGAVADLLACLWDRERHDEHEYAQRLEEVCKEVEATELVNALVSCLDCVVNDPDLGFDPRWQIIMSMRHMAMATEGARYFG